MEEEWVATEWEVMVWEEDMEWEECTEEVCTELVSNKARVTLWRELRCTYTNSARLLKWLK